MATFVLVPGAWLGAWAWKSVTAGLRARGHDVYPVSLTGLGERIHLAQSETDLETHIADVANLIRYEDLTDVVLVGHSYAGMVVTGVADRVPSSIGRLVYCDSAPGADGMALLDLQPPEAQSVTRSRVDEEGRGWLLPFPGFPGLGQGSSITGLDQPAQDLMTRKAAPQPFRTWTQPLRLTQGSPWSGPRAVILCEDGQQLMRSGPIAALYAEGEWQLRTMDTGHWPMLSQPDELTAVLDGLA